MFIPAVNKIVNSLTDDVARFGVLDPQFQLDLSRFDRPDFDL